MKFRLNSILVPLIFAGVCGLYYQSPTEWRAWGKSLVPTWSSVQAAPVSQIP